MALNVKQNTPVHKVALRNFTLLTLACHSEEESKYLRACRDFCSRCRVCNLCSDTYETSISTFILPCIFFVFLFLPGSVDATWRISSSSLRMCARQDCFVFERPQVVFYCNFSCSRHVSKSTNLIGRIVFDVARQTKKTNPRRFFLNDALTRGAFLVGVHTHIGALCLVTRR